MKNKSISDVYVGRRLGLCEIDRSVALKFLSLDSYHNDILSNRSLTMDLIKLLSAFELLCNLTIRDQSLAHQELRVLENSPLMGQFGEIILGLREWARGNGEAARPHFCAHLDCYSEDYIVLFMLHMFDFLHGRPDLYYQYLLADARGDDPDFGPYYKGMVAFAMCENSQPAEALHLATQACNRFPLNDIYSIHALVHCWHGLNDHRSVVDFLEASKPQWLDNPGMNMHVHWHLAVSNLELGLIDKAVENYWSFRKLTSCIHAEQDLDAVNFCVRMFTAGLPRPDFYNEYKILAKNWAPSIYNSLSYFNDVHAAFAFLMSGERTLMQKLLARPSLSGVDAETVRTGEEILRSISDFMNGYFSGCVDRLTATRPYWHRIGGSQAQREILDLLCNAAEAIMRMGQWNNYPRSSAVRIHTS